jgi:hypothetical protein
MRDKDLSNIKEYDLLRNMIFFIATTDLPNIKDVGLEEENWGSKKHRGRTKKNRAMTSRGILLLGSKVE